MYNNVLQGDCLEVLKNIDSNSIDLIYLDPPFFTQREYKNNGIGFDDKFDSLDHYITWLKERVQEIYRILKPKGSIYLHCDWHADSYIRVQILDKIFGYNNFRNSIVWHYQTGGASKNFYARKHDTIFYYTKTKDYTFNTKDIMIDRSEKSLIRAKNPNGARITKDNIKKLAMDVWADMQALNPMSKERIGYPTQKPEALLERIILASSNENDIVLDPFCGSGTTLVSAKKLGRKYIGIDISTDSIKICNERLA